MLEARASLHLALTECAWPILSPLGWSWRSSSHFSALLLSFIDKLTKEEEEIYKLQHDLERTAISQQHSKKVSEVRTEDRIFARVWVMLQVDSS